MVLTRPITFLLLYFYCFCCFCGFCGFCDFCGFCCFCCGYPTGVIEKAELHTQRDGRPKGVATVCYSTPREAQLAIAQLSGADMNGRPLRVRFDRFASQ